MRQPKACLCYLSSLCDMSRSYEKLPEALPSYTDSPHPRDRAGATNLSWLRWLVLATFSILLFSHHSGTLRRTSPVQDLSPTFISECHNLLQAPPGTYIDRISRLSSTLEEGTVWVSEPGTSAEYFLGGFSSRDWWLSERPLLLVIEGGSENVTILTAKFEQSRAELVDLPKEVRERTTFVPWLESESPYDVLDSYLTKGPSQEKKAVYDGQVRSFITSGLRSIGWSDASDDQVERVRKLRERKDEREVGLLRCANQVSPKVALRSVKDNVERV